MQAAGQADVKFDGLPSDIPALRELMSRRQWVAWRYLERDGDITKPPVNPHNGYGASHSDPSTWGTYEQAANWARDHGLPGVGYVISDDDDFTGADLDDCRDDEFGGIDAWANDIVRLAETYTEVSPSGRGLRLIWRGKVDKTFKCDPMHVEVYKHKRYLTITGNHIAGTPVEIRGAPKTEAALRERVETFKASSTLAPKAPPLRKSGLISTALAQISPSGGGSNFFREANSLALANLGRWVPNLFGSMAEFQSGTGAWRISSKSLGRNLQEDLSIAPNGIVDFGVHDMGDPRLGKRTPIDLALEFGSYRTAADAAKWLCDRVGVEPASIGWKEQHSHHDFESASNDAQEQAKTDPGALFEFLNVLEIKNTPDPNWLIAGLAIEKALGFIYGPPGCLKTFIALGMGLSFAVGMPDWWGRKIERQGAVVYISSEGQSDLKFRIQAWEQKNQVLADDSPFYLIRQTINFMKPEDVGKLLATVQAIKDIAQTDIAAVFVDTVSRVLPGADENLQKDMTLFVAACDAVRERFQTTVIGVHHTSRNGNMRGSTVFPGAGDFLVEVNREEGAKHGSIKAAKIKAAEDGWEQHFVVEHVAIGDIGGHTSLVVEPGDAPAPESSSGWPDKETCQRVLSAIREAWFSGKPWSNVPQSKRDGRYAPKNISSRFEIASSVAEHMLETWLMNGVLAVEIANSNTKIRGLKVVGSID